MSGCNDQNCCQGSACSPQAAKTSPPDLSVDRRGVIKSLFALAATGTAFACPDDARALAVLVVGDVITVALAALVEWAHAFTQTAPVR